MRAAIQRERCRQAAPFHRRKERRRSANRPSATSTNGSLRRDARLPARDFASIFWRRIYKAIVRGMRQLPHPTRDVRWYDSGSEVSLLRTSYPREKRIRIWVESYHRCFAWRRHGGRPATKPQRIVHLRHWPRIETRCLAGDRTRAAAFGTHRKRAWEICNFKSHARWPRRFAPAYTDHPYKADRSCLAVAGSKGSCGRDRMRRSVVRTFAWSAP